MICNDNYDDGNIVPTQEERFSEKNTIQDTPPTRRYVLEESKLNLNEIDHIVFFEKPFLKFERPETYMAFAPRF